MQPPSPVLYMARVMAEHGAHAHEFGPHGLAVPTDIRLMPPHLFQAANDAKA